MKSTTAFCKSSSSPLAIGGKFTGESVFGKDGEMKLRFGDLAEDLNLICQARELVVGKT